MRMESDRDAMFTRTGCDGLRSRRIAYHSPTPGVTTCISFASGGSAEKQKRWGSSSTPLAVANARCRSATCSPRRSFASDATSRSCSSAASSLSSPAPEAGDEASRGLLAPPDGEGLRALEPRGEALRLAPLVAGSLRQRALVLGEVHHLLLEVELAHGLGRRRAAHAVRAAEQLADDARRARRLRARARRRGPRRRGGAVVGLGLGLGRRDRHLGIRLGPREVRLRHAHADLGHGLGVAHGCRYGLPRRTHTHSTQSALV